MTQTPKAPPAPTPIIAPTGEPKPLPLTIDEAKAELAQIKKDGYDLQLKAATYKSGLAMGKDGQPLTTEQRKTRYLRTIAQINEGHKRRIDVQIWMGIQNKEINKKIAMRKSKFRAALTKIACLSIGDDGKIDGTAVQIAHDALNSQPQADEGVTV